MPIRGRGLEDKVAKSKKTIGDNPVAPVTEVRESVEHSQVTPGISTRELFAGLALVGTAANDDFDATEIAQRAVDAADALLAALAGGAA